MATVVNEAKLRLTAEDLTARGMASAARNAQRTADELERQARRAAQAVQRQQRFVAQVGTALATGVVATQTAKVIKDSYVEFAQADRQLSRIGNNAGKTNKEMQGVGRQMGSIANKFALPLDTVASGLDSLVAAGRSVEEAMDFLPSVAAAAQASGAEITDMTSSANALATSMGFTAQQMEHVFDILVAGGQAGNFELKDMARYLPQLAPMAAAMGYKGEAGLKKLVAILQVVRKQTGDAGQAADATREVFGKFNSEEMNNAFREFGNYDLKGVMQQAQKDGKDLLSTFLGFTRDVLNANANGMDPLLKLPLLFKDVQLQNGMRALLSQPGAVRELVAQLSKVDGTTVKNLANVTNDAAAASTRLSNSWKLVERGIGEVLNAAHAPEGLEWFANKLDRATEGLKNISRLGLGGAVKRALARDAVDGLTARRDDASKRLAGAKTDAEKRRLQEEVAGLQQQIDAAKGDYDRADTIDKQAAEGLPPTPDLPPPLPPELLTPRERPNPVIIPELPPMQRPLAPGFRDGPGAVNPFFQPTSFGQNEPAQEDTQERMARDISGLHSIFKRAAGPNAPSGRFGGLIQKASISTGDTEGDLTASKGGSLPGGSGGGSGGSGGGGGGGGEAGPRGGTAGMPNMRYGRGGATPGGGGGGGNSAGALQPGQGGPGVANYMHGQHGAPGSNLVQVRTPGGKTAMVHRDAAPSFQRFMNDLEAQGYKINSLGGHNHRNIRGSSKLSQHAYGNAIDINPGANPMGPNLITDMPPNIRELAAKYGLTWGGDFRGRKDAMHFEWNGTRPWEKSGQQAGAGGAARPGSLTERIEQAARAAGIDPRLMHGIRAGESGHRGDYDVKSDRAEDSYGPFQLNRRGGLGQEFEQETGLNAKDPRTIGAQADWVARYIAKQRARDPNWSPGRKWYGFKGLVNSDPRWGESGYQPDKPAGPPSLEAGGSGFKPDARPAPRLTPNQEERIRERPPSQARREMDRDMRQARLMTYSDVGIA